MCGQATSLTHRVSAPARTLRAVVVYLVQHGQAEAEDEDPQRPLTDRGADDAAWVAHWAIDRFGVQTNPRHPLRQRRVPVKRQRFGGGSSTSTPSRATLSPPTMTRRHGCIGSPKQPTT